MVRGLLKFTPVSATFTPDYPVGKASYTLRVSLGSQHADVPGTAAQTNFSDKHHFFETSAEDQLNIMTIHIFDKEGDTTTAFASLELAEILKLPNKLHHIKAQLAAKTGDNIVPDKEAAILVFELFFTEKVQSKLEIKVIDAALQRDTEAVGKMDPFVTLRLGSVSKRTKVKDEAGKTPVWNEEFSFLLQNPDKDQLEVVVLDEDMASDDLVGSANINLRTDGWTEITNYFVERVVALTFEKIVAGKLRIATRYSIS